MAKKRFPLIPKKHFPPILRQKESAAESFDRAYIRR